MLEIKLEFLSSTKIIRSANVDFAEAICDILCDYWKLHYIRVTRKFNVVGEEEFREMSPLMIYNRIKYIERLGEDNFEYLQAVWRKQCKLDKYKWAFEDFIQLSYEDAINNLIVESILK